MGEPARKYDLFDDDPVDPDSFVAPPAPSRRPARRVPAPEAPRRRRPARGEPERERRGRAVPAEPQRRRARPDEAEPQRRRARPGEPERRRARPEDPAPSRSPRSRPDREAAPADVTPDAPPAPVTAPRTPFVLLVLILVSAGIVGLLVLNTEINENSFRLEQMRERQLALDTREQQLSSQLADRQSPGNLAAAARRLGLVPADDPAFLRLPDGRIFRVPGPGRPTGR